MLLYHLRICFSTVLLPSPRFPWVDKNLKSELVQHHLTRLSYISVFSSTTKISTKWGAHSANSQPICLRNNNGLQFTES